MTDKVRSALEAFLKDERKKNRGEDIPFDMTEALRDTPVRLRKPRMLLAMLEAERPCTPEGDIFGFNRTVVHAPIYYDLKSGKKKRGGIGNITPNYSRILERGFDGLISDIDKALGSFSSYDDRSEFLLSMRELALAGCEFSDRYRDHARALGNERLAAALERIPRQGAESFYEVCLLIKIIIFVLRCGNCDHMTLGRFDQYAYPYYKKDIERGVSEEELFETLELFFISLNTDSDLYFGVQKGDNGQSMVLGGYNGEGESMYNELSFAALAASRELCLIDPKINMRVSSKTPDSIYELGTTLTKKGLGFPQYCNDDVAVPFLLSHGYEEKDALDYTVAACWEFIVPNCAFDVPNKFGFDFPAVVNRVIRNELTSCDSFEELMKRVRTEISYECDEIRMKRSPFVATGDLEEQYNFLSVFVDGCIEKGLDITRGGAKYNNYGCHGVGISGATDALAAVKRLVFDEKSVSPEELLSALDADFEGYTDLRNRLLDCPKLGCNDDDTNAVSCELMDSFATSLSGKPNHFFGGRWRAGTGSALEYIRLGKACGATADGRRAGEAYACSFSPSLNARVGGPLSVIQSFTKFDLKRIANGGPLTLELHDTVFRNEEGEKKVAQLVKAFILLGGHQLQLNAVNRERLLAAREPPERDPHLIVRVWGWSGYFAELDPEYQDHIIARTEFSV